MLGIAQLPEIDPGDMKRRKDLRPVAMSCLGVIFNGSGATLIAGMDNGTIKGNLWFQVQ